MSIGLADPLSGALERRADAIDRSFITAIAPDGAPFPMRKLDAHRGAGQLHWAISAFVFDETGALLIQRRAPGKYHSSGQWANTVCSHPDWGESLADCARRRLREELGLFVEMTPRAMLDYAAAVGDGLVERERVQVFRGDVRRARTMIDCDPAEVDAVRWAPVAALQAQARTDPAAFAPWFRIYLRRWDELGL